VEHLLPSARANCPSLEAGATCGAGSHRAPARRRTQSAIAASNGAARAAVGLCASDTSGCRATCCGLVGNGADNAGFIPWLRVHLANRLALSAVLLMLWALFILTCSSMMPLARPPASRNAPTAAAGGQEAGSGATGSDPSVPQLCPALRSAAWRAYRQGAVPARRACTSGMPLLPGNSGPGATSVLLRCSQLDEVLAVFQRLAHVQDNGGGSHGVRGIASWVTSSMDSHSIPELAASSARAVVKKALALPARWAGCTSAASVATVQELARAQHKLAAQLQDLDGALAVLLQERRAAGAALTRRLTVAALWSLRSSLPDEMWDDTLEARFRGMLLR
jgi:hypothetical protein